MIYDYYCSYCGKQQNQNTVLFDMQYLLTCDDKRQFNILKFRLTQAELKALINSGTATEHGYRKCSLTMAKIMSYIANKNNLDDPSIAALTKADATEYVKDHTAAPEASQDTEQDVLDMELLTGSGIPSEAAPEPKEESSENKPAKEKPLAIAALENKSKALVDDIYIENLLNSDLSVLMGLFAEKDVYEFELCEENDTDNEGNPVLEGYSMKANGVLLNMEARVCPGCGTKIFSHAGTAKHQSVSFIGSPRAGKTSTILSLTHYAIHYMDNGFGGGDIWKDCQMIDSVASVELVDKIERLTKDLDNYRKGIAPDKTLLNERKDAYSVTLRLSNRAESNKRYLLTLTDLPGELCITDGAIDKTKVETLFPVALTCDAFILCFDTQSLANNDGDRAPTELVKEVCSWADQFQSIRARYNNQNAKHNTYVPTMVLFTKCEELEDPNAPKPVLGGMQPLEKMYSLKTERHQISTNNMYKYFRDRFSEHGHLNKAYHAMMRCSPYGYDAPSTNAIERMSEAEKVQKIKKTEPKNVDLLMRWLLSVSGCIPTEATFSVGHNTTPYQLRNFCISRPQLRSENPGDLVKGIDEIKESMARCALFENPGRFDKLFVGKHNDGPFVLGPVRFDAKMHPQTNDREERNR